MEYVMTTDQKTLNCGSSNNLPVLESMSNSIAKLAPASYTKNLNWFDAI